MTKPTDHLRELLRNLRAELSECQRLVEKLEVRNEAITRELEAPDHEPADQDA